MTGMDFIPTVPPLAEDVREGLERRCGNCRFREFLQTRTCWIEAEGRRGRWIFSSWFAFDESKVDLYLKKGCHNFSIDPGNLPLTKEA